jgi:hypothetical protein
VCFIFAASTIRFSVGVPLCVVIGGIGLLSHFYQQVSKQLALLHLSSPSQAGGSGAILGCYFFVASRIEFSGAIPSLQRMGTVAILTFSGPMALFFAPREPEAPRTCLLASVSARMYLLVYGTVSWAALSSDKEQVSEAYEHFFPYSLEKSESGAFTKVGRCFCMGADRRTAA